MPDGRKTWKGRYPWMLPALMFAFLNLSACASARRPEMTQPLLPPLALLNPIELPDRSRIETVGDMARVILEDEKVIASKNADLKALREYWQPRK